MIPITFLLAILSQFPTHAAIFEAHTRSEGGSSCDSVGENPVSCQSGSRTGQVAEGSVNVRAGSQPGDFAFVSISLNAYCYRVSDCLSQSGNGSVTMDLAIHGKAAGTIGLVELLVFVGSFGQSEHSFPGLTLSSIQRPYLGPLYEFKYEEPFEIRLSYRASCSECNVGTTTRLTGPLRVFDMELNLVDLIDTPQEAVHTPEPSTVQLAFAGILCLLVARVSVRQFVTGKR